MLVVLRVQLNYTSEQLIGANVYLYHSWTSSVSALSAYDPSAGALTLAGSVPDDVYDGASGNRYRLVNIADAPSLAPGTFFVSGGVITYRALPGEDPTDPAGAVFVLPRLQTVLTMSANASAGEYVQNMRFVNLTLAHTDAALESCLSYGCCGQSGTGLPSAVVQGWALRDVSFEGVEVTGAGQYGVWVHEYSQRVRLSRAHVHDLGAGGIRVGEAVSGTAPVAAALTTNVTVTDCEIHDAGHVVEAGVGLFIQQAAFITAVHNEIHHLYYTAVSTGWTWGYDATSNEHLNVSFNHLHDVFQGRLSDGGCIYNLGASPGTTFDHNLCHDVVSFGYGGWGWVRRAGRNGGVAGRRLLRTMLRCDRDSARPRLVLNYFRLRCSLCMCCVVRTHSQVASCFLCCTRACTHRSYYDDEGSSNLTWTNNIAYNTKCAGLHQHYGINNAWANNVFAYPDVAVTGGGGDAAGVRSSQWPPGSGKGDVSSFTFHRNIVLLRNASATLFYTSMATGLANMCAARARVRAVTAPRSWLCRRRTFDDNCYWSEAVPPSALVFPPTQAPVAWSAWQAEGKDVHGVVADPQARRASGCRRTVSPRRAARSLSRPTRTTSPTCGRPHPRSRAGSYRSTRAPSARGRSERARFAQQRGRLVGPAREEFVFRAFCIVCTGVPRAVDTSENLRCTCKPKQAKV